MACLNVNQDALRGSELAQFPTTIVDRETVVTLKTTDHSDNYCDDTASSRKRRMCHQGTGATAKNTLFCVVILGVWNVSFLCTSPVRTSIYYYIDLTIFGHPSLLLYF